VGHEFTHGVTERESELIYSNESGAITESLSDMWGEWIDQTNGAGNDSSAVKWYLFEDWASDPWPWRRMDDPTLCKTSSWYGTNFGDIPQPDRLYGPGWYYGSQDHYGVHHNLGVGNKLCYLLTDGGDFNGYTISGMGISKTADLFYKCQTNLLTDSSDYYDLGNVLILAADRLGLTPTERNNVKEACAAVEILPQECFPVCHPDYVEWVIVGKPTCWCNPRQCNGDADGASQGKKKYWVSTYDLDILIAAWNKPFAEIEGVTHNGVPLICADFAHDTQGKKKYRVSTNDLDILVANWNQANLPDPDCLDCGRGQQAKGGEVDIERIFEWIAKVWLDPEVRKVIGKKRWLEFIESLKAELERK